MTDLYRFEDIWFYINLPVFSFHKRYMCDFNYWWNHVGLTDKKMRNETANNILGLAQNDFNNQYHTRTLQSKI